MRMLIIISTLVASCTLSMARDLSIPEANISGAKVETEMSAKRLAFDNYIQRMDGNISATETVRDISIQILGYTMDGFADRGTKLWEARVTDKDELRAIIWINPNTEQIYFVCGPWDLSISDNSK